MRAPGASCAQQLEELERTDSPLDPAPRLRGARWVEPPPRDPRRVRRVDGRRAPPPGRVQGPGARQGRSRRPPRARAVESAKATAAAERAHASREASQADDEISALDALGKEGTWTVGGREIRVTNLDKVLFPAREGGEPVTKRDLLRYHVQIAPTLIPYLRIGASQSSATRTGSSRRASGRRTCPGMPRSG